MHDCCSFSVHDSRVHDFVRGGRFLIAAHNCHWLSCWDLWAHEGIGSCHSIFGRVRDGSYAFLCNNPLITRTRYSLLYIVKEKLMICESHIYLIHLVLRY